MHRIVAITFGLTLSFCGLAAEQREPITYGKPRLLGVLANRRITESTIPGITALSPEKSAGMSWKRKR